MFTVKPGDDAGMTDYCFFLSAHDDARDADDRAAENSYEEVVATFSVNWPAGPPAPPPGPTFEFFTPPATVGDALVAADSLRVGEGATTDNVYWVKLKDAPAAATYPLEMTVNAPATVTTAVAAGANSDGMFGSATDSVSVTVTTQHDLNIASELRSLTHMAKDFDDTDFMVRVLDDDLTVSIDRSSVREDADAMDVEVTVTAGLGADITSAVTVSLAPRAGTSTTTADFDQTTTRVDVTVAAATRTGKETIEVMAVDDAVQNEVNEAIQFVGPNNVPTTGAAYVNPAYLMIVDDDPDITLSVDVDEVDEDAGTVTVEITATADAPVGGILTLDLTALASADAANGIDAGTAEAADYTLNPTTVTLRIDGGSTSGTATVSLTIVDDGDDESNETIVLWDADGGAAGGKTYTTAPVMLTIIDNDDT